MQQARIESLRSLLLALAFYGFFEASKHILPLTKVNPFADERVEVYLPIRWACSETTIVRNWLETDDSRACTLNARRARGRPGVVVQGEAIMRAVW
jgi:hypothetical protein